MKHRHLVPVLFAAWLLILLPCLSGARPPDPTLTEVPGQPSAPDFDLPDVDGHHHRLADYLGNPLIVNFWATWCPPCRAEMPALQRAWELLRDEGIALIAINVGEDPEAVQAFLLESPVRFPLLLDEDMRVSPRWPMRGLPTTFVVDGAGRLVYQAVGERAWDDPELLSRIRSLKTKPTTD